MRLEILQLPDCPNAVLLARRIDEVMSGGQIKATITRRVVDNPAAAIAAGMTGSPTLLLDGEDPFFEPGLVAGLSCRLYRTEEGRFDGAPSVRALRLALRPGP